ELRSADFGRHDFRYDCFALVDVGRHRAGSNRADRCREPVVNAGESTFSMPLLGAHMSIAGGYYKAVEEAHRTGCDVVQLFTKNNNQWRAKPIGDEEVALFAG